MQIDRQWLWPLKVILIVYFVGKTQAPGWAKVIMDLTLVAFTFPHIWDWVEARGWRVPVWTRFVLGLALFAAFLALNSLRPTPAQEHARATTLYLTKVTELDNSCIDLGLDPLDVKPDADRELLNAEASISAESCTTAAGRLKDEEVPDYLTGQARADVEIAVRALADAYTRRAAVYGDLAKATPQSATPEQVSAARAQAQVPPTRDHLAALTTALQTGEGGAHTPN